MKEKLSRCGTVEVKTFAGDSAVQDLKWRFVSLPKREFCPSISPAITDEVQNYLRGKR